MTPRDQGRNAVAECAGQAQQDAKTLPAGKTEIFAMQDDDADQSGNHTGDAPRGKFFLAGRGHDRDGKQRRRRVEDRSKAARDIGLPGNDQRERQHVVEQRHRKERLPARQAPGKRQAIDPQPRQQDDRGNRDTQEYDGEGRQFPQYHAVEEE